MKEKKENIKEILIRIALILVIAIIIIASFGYIRQLNTKNVISSEFYQYIGEVKQEYVGEIELSKEGEITTLRAVNIDLEMDSTPVYYKNENKTIFPEDMEIIFPMKSVATYKIPRFSSVLKEMDSTYAEINNKKISIQNAFLFDGGNLYMFIEQTTINIDNEEYKISPFSYVIVDYNEETQIYDKEKDEIKTLDTNGKQVTATNGDYKLDLNTDSITIQEKEQLLPIKIEKLKILNQ